MKDLRSALRLLPAIKIARSLKDAPQWHPAAYFAAMDGESLPARIALVAEEITPGEVPGEHAPGAKARVDSSGFMRGLKPPPPSAASFSAASGTRVDSAGVDAGIKVPAYRSGPVSLVVVGFAVASLIAPEAELETIAVAAEGQRRSVGRRLF